MPVLASSAVDQSKVSSSGSRSVLTLSGSEEFASVTSSAQMAFKSSMIGVVPFAKSSSATNSRSKSSTGNSEGKKVVLGYTLLMTSVFCDLSVLKVRLHFHILGRDV